MNVLAIHGMNDVLPTDPPRNDLDFFFDVTLAGNRVLSQSNQVFITPTPGAMNETPAAPAPRIVGGDGIFFGTKTFQLVLDDPTPTLEIRYTLDGSTPTITSNLYGGPITLTMHASRHSPLTTRGKVISCRATLAAARSSRWMKVCAVSAPTFP